MGNGAPVPHLRERLAWLRRFRGLVTSQREHLCDLIERDMGKPRADALVQDVIPLLAACRWLERHAPRLLKERRVGWGGVWTLGQSHRIARVPLGHVGIIATWNYPVQLLGIQLIQALIAGNRVTVKPSENAPRSQARLLEIAIAAGNRVFPALWWTAPTREAGAQMLREARFDHVVFTGSTGVGRSIAEWAAGTLTPTTLELSGNDSAFVLADADAALAARSIWAAVTMNAGQTCMAPHRVLVLRPAYGAFLKALSPLVASAKPVSLVNEAAVRRVWEVMAGSLQHGPARPLSGVTEPPPPGGRSFTPAAIVDCTGTEPAVVSEHFGPLLAVVPVDSVKDALRIHHSVAQHLSASIYTGDPRAARELAPHLRTGIVTINDTVLPTAHPGLAITGLGESGWGASRGVEGLLALTRPLHTSTTSPLIRPPVDPLTAKMGTTLSGLAGWLYARGRTSPPARTESKPPSAVEPTPAGEAVLRAAHPAPAAHHS